MSLEAWNSSDNFILCSSGDGAVQGHGVTTDIKIHVLGN